MSHSLHDLARNPLCILNASVRLGNAYGNCVPELRYQQVSCVRVCQLLLFDSVLNMNPYPHQRLKTVIIYSTKKPPKLQPSKESNIRRHLKQTDELKINIHHNQKIFHLRILKILNKLKCFSITGKLILQVSW